MRGKPLIKNKVLLFTASWEGQGASLCPRLEIPRFLSLLLAEQGGRRTIDSCVCLLTLRGISVWRISLAFCRHLILLIPSLGRQGILEVRSPQKWPSGLLELLVLSSDCPALLIISWKGESSGRMFSLTWRESGQLSKSITSFLSFSIKPLRRTEHADIPVFPTVVTCSYVRY